MGAKESTKEYYKNDRVICRICGIGFRHLGSHVFHKHGYEANQYKTMFGLPHKLSLISPMVEAKKQKRFEEKREKYLANLKVGNKFRFEKGHKYYKPNYKPEREKERNTERIVKYNTRIENVLRLCPCCNQRFAHLESHLANKHNLKFMD